MEGSAAGPAFPTPRFSGPRWVVIMDEALWRRFRTEVPAAAYERLTVKFEHLAKHGEADMPRPRLRWSPCPDTTSTRIATIEARGTVISGRVTEIDGRKHFFIQSIAVDPADEAAPARRGRKRSPDKRQGVLRLEADE